MNTQKPQTEKELQKQVCQYLKIAYPQIIFTSDMSGLRYSIGYAKTLKNLRSENGMPDLHILCPNKGFAGLFIELKRENAVLYKKNGLPKSEHLKTQIALHDKLKSLGYKVEICCGFEAAKKVIDSYLQ